MFLHTLRSSERFGLFELMRMLTGRFREVGSMGQVQTVLTVFGLVLKVIGFWENVWKQG